MPDDSPARLDEYDKDEWRAVAKRLCPDWTEEQYEDAWARFIEMKRRKEQN